MTYEVMRIVKYGEDAKGFIHCAFSGWILAFCALLRLGVGMMAGLEYL